MSTTTSHDRPGAPHRTRRAPSTATLWRVEVAKTVTTRSGRAVLAAAVALPALYSAVAATSSTTLGAVGQQHAHVMAVTICSYLVTALGVMSMASEWSTRSAELTFRLVPGRGRVLVAKALALLTVTTTTAVVVTVLSALVIGSHAPGTAFGTGGPFTLAHLGAAVVRVVAGLALWAVTGLGWGAAVRNAPSAFVLAYLVPLYLPFALGLVAPTWVPRVHPGQRLQLLVAGDETTASLACLGGWAAVLLVAGALLTVRGPRS